MASKNLMKLGNALADAPFTFLTDVDVGLSGAHGDYSLEREAEDISAMVAATCAPNVFGLSSGAIIALEAAPPTTSYQESDVA